MAGPALVAQTEVRMSLTAELDRSTQSALKGFNQLLGGAFRTAAGGVGTFSNLGGAVKNFAGTLGPAGAAIGTVLFNLSRLGDINLNLTKNLVSTGISLEGVRQRIKFAAGSTSEAERIFSFFSDTVERVGLDFQTTAETFAKFIAAVRQSPTLELQQGLEIFEAFAEASSVLRLSGAEAAGIFLALEQMVSRGFVSMEELRRQLGNRLPGAFELAARSMGKTTVELQKLVSSGELATADFLPDFAAEVKRSMADSIDEASRSAFASINRYNKALLLLKDVAAQELLPVIADVVEELSEFAASDRAVDLAREYGEALASVAGFLDENAEELTEVISKTLEFSAQLLELSADILPAVNRALQITVDLLGKLGRFVGIQDILDALRELGILAEDAGKKLEQIDPFLQLQVSLGLDVASADDAFDIVSKLEEGARIAEPEFKRLNAELERHEKALSRVRQQTSGFLELAKQQGQVTPEIAAELTRLAAAGRNSAAAVLMLEVALQQAQERGFIILEGEPDKEFEKARKAALAFAEGLGPPQTELQKLAAAQEKIAEDFREGLLTAEEYRNALGDIATVRLANSLERTTKALDENREAMAKAAEEGQKLKDRLQDLADQGDPVSAALRQAGEDLAFIDAMMRLGIGTAEQWEDAIRGALDALEEFSVGALADDVTKLNDSVLKTARELPDLADSYSLLFNAASDVFDAIGEDSWARAARAIGDMINQVIALRAAMEQLQKASGVAQGSQVAAQSSTASAASMLSGLASALSILGAAYTIFNLVVEARRDRHPDLQSHDFEFRSGVGAGVVVDPKTETLIERVGQRFITSTLDALGPFLDRFNDSIQNAMRLLGVGFQELGNTIVAEVQSIMHRGEEAFKVTRGLDEIIFETLDEAIGFALQTFLQDAIAAGTDFDAALKDLAQNFHGDFAQFEDALSRVQGLADQANMALDGMSALGIEITKLPGQLEALRQELQQLGLSSAQVSRLVGGQLVQSFQAWRQQITGEELSVEQRQAIAEAQRQLFNAELELQIARLEAEKAALIAEAGIAQSEVQLHSNVIQAQGRFVNAKAGLANAELGVMQGFVSGAGAIIKSGVQLIGDTSRVLGDVLGSLPEEIRKQVEAIQKVIDALKAIGTIGPGDIRIPGVGGGVVGGAGGGGGGPSGPSLQDTIRDLISTILDDIAAQQAMVDAMEDALNGLGSFLRDLRIGSPSPLTPGRQVDLLRTQLLEASRAAEMGDLEAIQEFQRIAQQIRTIGAEAFGTAGSGFEALLREIERLGGDIIEDGNVIFENQEDILSDIRNEFADLLLATRDLHDLNAEQIKAIREGTDAETGGNLTLLQELANGNKQTNKDLKELIRVLVQFGRILADAT